MTLAPKSGSANPVAGWASLIVVYVVWGSTYLAIRVADETIPPLVMAGLRYVVAAALLLPFVTSPVRRTPPDAVAAGGGSRRTPWADLRIKQLLGCSLVGILMLAGGNGGVSWAERTIPSGLAALLVATVPLWMAVTNSVMTRAAPGTLSVAAVVVGFGGVAILADPGTHGGRIIGIVVVLVASVSWAVGSLLGRRLRLPDRPMVATAFEMLFGGLVLLIAATVLGEWTGFHPGAVSLRSWLALVYLIGPGSLLALSCYMAALRLMPTSIVATYAYVNPIVAVFLGWAILNESFTSRTLLGGVFVIGAVALTVADQHRRTSRAEHASV